MNPSANCTNFLGKSVDLDQFQDHHTPFHHRTANILFFGYGSWICRSMEVYTLAICITQHAAVFDPAG